MDPAQQCHLEVIARLRRIPDLDVGPAEHIERPHQVLAREARHQGAQSITIALGRHLGVVETGGIDGQDEQIATDAGQLPADQTQIVARLDESTRQLEEVGRSLVGHGLDRIEQQVAADQTEHRRHIVGRDLLARERDNLIERAQGIAHAAVGRPRQQAYGTVVDRDLLRLGDRMHLVGNGRGADGAELEDLRPG